VISAVVDSAKQLIPKFVPVKIEIKCEVHSQKYVWLYALAWWKMKKLLVVLTIKNFDDLGRKQKF